MVEGPGATRNGRKVQPVIGWMLTEVQCRSTTVDLSSHNNENKNSSSSTLTSSSTASSPPRIVLEGRDLMEAYCVGKEVFLLFGPVLTAPSRSSSSSSSSSMQQQGRCRQEDSTTENRTSTSMNTNRTEQQQQHEHEQPEPASAPNTSTTTNKKNMAPIALRFHFGMNGSLTVRKIGTASTVAPWRRKETTSKQYTLVFGRHSSTNNNNEDGGRSTKGHGAGYILETIASTCTIVSVVVAHSKLQRLKPRDVCGRPHEFDPEEVLKSFLPVSSSSQQQQQRMISDVLLDQEKFPGVGNIIKIEGLHHAGIHPRTRIGDLSRSDLFRTILACRTYAMGWLTKGRAPTKKVYNKINCGSCITGRVRMVKLGQDLSRVTFWCEHCQPYRSRSSTNDAASASGLSGVSTLHKENSPNTIEAGTQHQLPLSVASVSTSLVSKNQQLQRLPRRAPPPPGPRCPQHGANRMVLRRVRKQQGPNLSRLFRICTVRGCPYFAWADAHLPNCVCGRKTVLRISKTEKTGGSWFLSCSSTSSRTRSNTTTKHQNKNKNNGTPSSSCSFFQWATKIHIDPLANELSPLT